MPEDLKTSRSLSRWRMTKDRLARVGIAVGGIGVIIAILLIFIYLFYVVLPMFLPAGLESEQQYSAARDTETVALLLEEQAEIGVRFKRDGSVVYFRLADGEVTSSSQLALPEGTWVSTADEGLPGSDYLALGLSNGEVLVVRQQFALTYGEKTREVVPSLTFPLGEAALKLGESAAAIRSVSVSHDEYEVIIAAIHDDNTLAGLRFELTRSLLGDVTVEQQQLSFPEVAYALQELEVSGDQRWLITADELGWLNLISLNESQARIVDRQLAVSEGEKITAMNLLLGGTSLLTGTSKGKLEQWFPVRDESERYTLERIRSFREEGAAIVAIEPEQQRKGFVSVDEAGELDIYLTTAEREVLSTELSTGNIHHVAFAPRSKTLLIEDDDQVQVYKLKNDHPEASVHSLFQKVWYEGYEQPEFVWQSSAANSDFEPKYSIMPLAFGTLKAAFYAMLFAMPLAILGAIYTAYFMSPALRKVVKPSIEMMEALPTVVLGFLAGLWLAPILENHLPGVFTFLLLAPAVMLLFGFLWHQLADHIQDRIPAGWHVLLLLPLMLITGWLCAKLSMPLENLLFAGDIRVWLGERGINYDQRNALVVGIAMGFAVIPTIFSITEDAVFGVPRHLVRGSLALGATPWQTLHGVVLPTASPAIFSAVMIGFGRAVGETMIVLMATGNTPVMEWNIFEGMRTLAANIAVEMPESEMASTHYRLLFLTAFGLLVFTFLLNSVAEYFRHRLRKKYSLI